MKLKRVNKIWVVQDVKTGIRYEVASFEEALRIVGGK